LLVAVVVVVLIHKDGKLLVEVQVDIVVLFLVSHQVVEHQPNQQLISQPELTP
jgi:hypothetical protein